MANLIRRFLVREDGPTAVEYAVMLALIVGACIASVNVLAQAAGDSFNDSGSQLSGVIGTVPLRQAVPSNDKYRSGDACWFSQRK
jgi:pilus assembly protein Flp/PilA